MSEYGQGGDSPPQEPWWKVFVPSFLRRGRVADLSDVPIGKIQRDAEERGIRIDLQDSVSGRRTAQVNKVVVRGDDER